MHIANRWRAELQVLPLITGYVDLVLLTLYSLAPNIYVSFVCCYILHCCCSLYSLVKVATDRPNRAFGSSFVTLLPYLVSLFDFSSVVYRYNLKRRLEFPIILKNSISISKWFLILIARWMAFVASTFVSVLASRHIPIINYPSYMRMPRANFCVFSSKAFSECRWFLKPSILVVTCRMIR